MKVLCGCYIIPENLAKKIISSYPESIVQKVSTGGVKSQYSQANGSFKDTFSHEDINRRNWGSDEFLKKYYNVNPLKKSNQNGTYFPNIFNNPVKPITTADTKFTNLNDYAYEKILKTAYGDVEVFLDIYDDNDASGAGKFEANAFLFNFDSNKDGFIDSSDKYFDKLKVRGYDKDGNEKILKLSDVVDFINLSDFIKKDTKGIDEKITDIDMATQNTDYRVYKNNSNPYSMFDPKYRYGKISKNDLASFFKQNASSDGWVSPRNNNIFNKSSEFSNFAYEKIGANGNKILSEFSPIGSSGYEKGDKNFSYASYQKESFMKFYNDYKKEAAAHQKDVEWLSNNLKKHNVENADIYINKLQQSKSSFQVGLENEFSKATGMEFSLENLENLKRAFEKDANKAATTLKDADSVVAMKLNNNGTITLKFDSGREMTVDELYSDSGRLLDKNLGQQKYTHVPVKPEQIIEANKMDMKQTAIKVEDKFITLKDFGVKSIKKMDDKFLLHMENGDTKTAMNLYFIKQNLSVFADVKSNNEQIFFRKVDTRA